MELRTLVETSRRIAETSKRLEKISLLADLLRNAAPEDIPIAINYLSGTLRQGKIGIGYATLFNAGSPAGESPQQLTLAEVDEIFERIAAGTGLGSSEKRRQLIRELLSRAGREESDFLVRLVGGELRQGSLKGIMIEALARAAYVPVEKMRAAVMLSGDIALAGRAALEKGAAGLEQFEIRILHSFQPMLAQTAKDIGDAMNSLGEAALEFKMDGVRIQAHKLDREVRIFTRNLNDVTETVPDLAEILLRVSAASAVLDGEALAMGKGGKPRSFQVTMRRFGRKLDVAAMREALPLTPFFFDCLYLDGKSLMSQKESVRFSALRRIAPPEFLMPRTVTSDRGAAERFLAEARGAGHEGIMAKAPDALYEPGIRSGSWLKVKPSYTLDLVVLAAEWGHGRRRGRLSNLHLGARDPEHGGFIMLGKTFKGLTDAMLEWQTKRLLELESSRDQWTVCVRPELVVEIAFNDIQASPRYPGGLALRFARVLRYRPDKTAEEADTIDNARLLFTE